MHANAADVAATDPPRKRPKNRKAQIALVAAELFCARGYHLVGIDEIAAAVGISGPAVYRHFPNKYAILVHATRELVEAALAATEPEPEHVLAADPQAELEGLLTSMARFTVERRKVGALYQWEWRYLADEHRAEFRAALATLVRRFAEPLRRLRPELSPAGAEFLVRAALSTFGSLTTHRAAAPKARTEATLHRLGWAMLRADAPTAALVRSARGAAAERAAEPAPGGLEPRRELLLAAAIRLFHRLGYHAVGMEDIGGAAGINASSVYRYFPSKADLLAAAYYRASDRLAASAAAALRGTAEPDDALRRLAEAYTGFAFGESDLVSVYLAENSNLPEPDRHELRKVQRLHVEEWVRLLVQTRPELPPAEARVLVHAAINLVTDLGRAVRFTRSGGAPAFVTRLALVALAA
ncbi:TetR family transcriptional regulator [Dactylosporangium sp. AC04546]|uniref:TetR/AcrR family transcriptional regulator n=1 Tax=Dactylosporangium sp. AC04546 TaxID=2862460 RepID=UPI001EE07EA8|nr:TetR/AcrR family transcriptional regulator [Dactylosporangium sp. AC04546]WVK79014.1 TetR family transcriptional regulator [Dactylosporangium sp. AC04546]